MIAGKVASRTKSIEPSKRFANWCKLAPLPTKTLAHRVENVLVPAYVAAGFHRTAIFLNNPADPVSGREINLERAMGDDVAYVTFSFDKYRMPRFQIRVGRVRPKQDPTWVWSANVVKKRSQYFYFWGKPWWLPVGWWSNGMTSRLIERVLAKTPEVLVFLEEGRRSSSLSQSPLQHA